MENYTLKVLDSTGAELKEVKQNYKTSLFFKMENHTGTGLSLDTDCRLQINILNIIGKKKMQQIQDQIENNYIKTDSHWEFHSKNDEAICLRCKTPFEFDANNSIDFTFENLKAEVKPTIMPVGVSCTLFSINNGEDTFSDIPRTAKITVLSEDTDVLQKIISISFLPNKNNVYLSKSKDIIENDIEISIANIGTKDIFRYGDPKIIIKIPYGTIFTDLTPQKYMDKIECTPSQQSDKVRAWDISAPLPTRYKSIITEVIAVDTEDEKKSSGYYEWILTPPAGNEDVILPIGKNNMLNFNFSKIISNIEGSKVMIDITFEGFYKNKSDEYEDHTFNLSVVKDKLDVSERRISTVDFMEADDGRHGNKDVYKLKADNKIIIPVVKISTRYVHHVMIYITGRPPEKFLCKNQQSEVTEIHNVSFANMAQFLNEGKTKEGVTDIIVKALDGNSNPLGGEFIKRITVLPYK